MKRKLTAGTTGLMLAVRVFDSSSTTGGYLSGLTFASSGLLGKYRREGDAAWTAITIVTATAGTFTSGGWAVPTGGPTGSYEIHIPNAAIASGKNWVEIEFYGVTNMVPVRIEIELDAVNYQDSVRMGLTALPNAAAGVAGGLPLAVDASGRVDLLKINGTSQTARDLGASVLLSNGTGAGQVKLSSGYVAPNWGDVGNPNTAVLLSGTTVKTATDVETDTQDIQSRLPAALISGRIDAVAAAGVALTTDNITAIALSVFRRLVGGSAAIGQLIGPTQGEPLDAINSADFDLVVDVGTDASSVLVLSIRHCADDTDPVLEADSSAGLTILTGVTTPTANHATVVRTSSTRVTVHIRAASFINLAPGAYTLELRELKPTGTLTMPRFECAVQVRRSASRRVS